jgi:hypothetical protein
MGCTVCIEKTHPMPTHGHGRAYELHILENTTPSPPLLAENINNNHIGGVILKNEEIKRETVKGKIV